MILQYLDKILVASMALAAIVGLYFWHYQPMGELNTLKQEKQESKIINVVETVKADSFTDKQEAKKKSIQTKKENHVEINTTTGRHIIHFR